MTVTSSPARPRYHQTGEPISSPDAIDFFTERDRLLAEIDKFNGQLEIDQEVRKGTHRRSTTLFERLEDWLYSLLSAAALVSLLWGILGLADFPVTSTQRAGTEQSDIVLRGMPRGTNLDSASKILNAQPQGVTLLPN
jgi:hypothetical protein